MKINTYKMTADKRKLDKTSSLTFIKEYDNCAFKDDTSMNTPIIKLRESDMSKINNANYIYISSLDNYYFIQDIVYLNNSVLELHCKNDVLMSNRLEINNLQGVVARQENLYNLYLNDDKYKTYNYTRTQTKLFPAGLTAENYVLAVAGLS